MHNSLYYSILLLYFFQVAPRIFYYYFSLFFIISSLIIAIITESNEIKFPIALANAFTAKLYIVHNVIIIIVIPLYFFNSAYPLARPGDIYSIHLDNNEWLSLYHLYPLFSLTSSWVATGISFLQFPLKQEVPLLGNPNTGRPLKGT